MTAAPDIFLSYNREDQAVAKRYADAFAAAGLGVWWDTALRSGEAYDEVTEAALRGAKAVVVLWSPRSVVSRWVRAEATIADRCKTLVPATIEPCERPIMFELTQTADLSHWSGDLKDEAWLAFLEDVRGHIRRKVTETPLALLIPEASTMPEGTSRGEAPSLAVLPFTNRSGLPEDDVLADGLVEDLTDALARGVHARVLASSTTARFCRGAIPDIEAMGRQLGVRFLLEGNVRRIGTSLRVTAQLVEAEGGAILWTQKFDRPLVALSNLQEDLIVELASHLGTQLFQAAMENALKRPGGFTAWERVTRSLAANRNFSGDSLPKAIDEASMAVAIDPDYGLAHAVLAASLAMHYNVFCPDNPDEVGRIRHHIDRALACGHNAADVLGQVAYALCYLYEPEEALQRATRSMAISPSYGVSYLSAGIANVLLDKPEAALANFSDFRQFEPNSPYEHYAHAWDVSAHLQSGNWTAALHANAQSLELNADASHTLCYRAMILQHLGQAEKARKSMLEARRRDPSTSQAMWELRLRRWTADAPIRQQLLNLFRPLWAMTEGTP